MVQKYLACIIAVVIFPVLLHAQKISYSIPDRDDVRSVDFDIIGKVSNHYLVYKTIHSVYSISIFDDDMKLLDKVKMDFLPEKLISTDIIAYKDFFYFIYQYQKKNIAYCAAAHIDADGKIVGDPVILDTTTYKFFCKQ